MKEPLSTVTNAAYIILAAVVAIQDPDSMLLAASLMALGVASGLFHYYGSVIDSPSHRADEGAIYVVLSVLLIQIWGAPWWLLLPVAGGLTVLLTKMKAADLFKIAPLLSLAIILSLLLVGQTAVALAVLGLGAISALVRFKMIESDLTHALWHILSATGLYFAWLGTIN